MKNPPLHALRARLFASALAAMLALVPAAGQAACGLALPSADTTPPLPRVAAALRPDAAPAGGPRLDVLVLGSATVLGPGGSTSGSFPDAMEQALRAAVPGLQVAMTVHGGRGQTAAEMLELMRQHLASDRFQLVLWQTGTVEAVRRIPPASFAATVAQGVAAAHAAGADVMFVDPQYSKILDARADLPPYRAAILAAITGPGTAVLDRYSLMQGWAQSGALNLDRTPRAQRAEAVAQLHACLGEMLARRVLAGAKAAGVSGGG